MAAGRYPNLLHFAIRREVFPMSAENNNSAMTDLFYLQESRSNV